MATTLSIPQSIIDALAARDTQPATVDVVDLSATMERPYYVGRVLAAGGDVLWYSGACRTAEAAAKLAKRELRRSA